jgi:ABC-2 type transport system permease protein
MFWLGIREIRTSLRMPAYFIPNLLIPVFFFFVLTGQLDRLASQFGLENYAAFQLPVALLFAVTGGSAGLNMVADIESGYFDKLLLTPTSRLAILIGAMSADFVRILVQGAFVTALALVTGTEFATGVVGAVGFVLLAGVWGLAYSAIGFAVALRTGNAQTTQSMWILFFPLVMLTTSFAPMEALSGWIKTAARFNPMTYVLDGLRAFSLPGGEVRDVGVALLVAGVFGIVTVTFALRSLLSRIR